MAERAAAGRFNAVGPAQPLTIGELLDGCLAVTGSGAEIGVGARPGVAGAGRRAVD